MNTVEKGDSFEIYAYDLIVAAIENDRLGISPKYAKVFRKKRYFSGIRKKEIIIDLSIEIWPPNSERYSIVYLIECKDYSTKDVPVGDIENFLYKVREIKNSHHNDAVGIKGAFISNSSFQESAFNIAKEVGLMIIEVTKDNELNIRLHKGQNESKSETEISEIKEIETFLYSVLELNKIQGLRRYSREQLANIAKELIEKVDKQVFMKCLATPVSQVIEFLESMYKLNFNFQSHIEIDDNKIIHGYFDINKNQIVIDKSIVGTERFSFLIAHEIGHFILHRELRIHQQVYNDFQDSEYDFATNKHLLNNSKNWIEWQANEFASNLIMPNLVFYTRLVYIQKQLGIKREGHIYLDDQPVNRKDFGDITTYLANFFNTSYTSVIMKLESLGLITYDRSQDKFKSVLRNLFNDIEE
ncbi:MAG: ImmA/IrrE family metallo-endopeptidase [Bacteroidetes bacterium]|nr:ImmA/IrrE family metallo-endopeptidase [Bacteroidota bacterium]